MKDFSIDIIKNAVEKSFIKAEYNENIVYRWLKRPCLLFTQKQNILSQESLFYICFQLLDHMKQYEYLDDCQLQNEIQCIPFYVERLFEECNYQEPFEEYSCTLDRLLIMITLHTLLRLLGDPKADRLAQYLLSDMNCTMPHDLVSKNSKHYLALQKDIRNTLTDDSTSKHSKKNCKVV